MASIFISYRRDDAADVTGRINDRLVARFGKDVIFTDVDSIPLGVDFRVHLESEVSRCDVLLAVIGKDWLSVRNMKSELRLHDKADFVRIEIESALRRNVPVIPLLVQGASMPIAEELPESLHDLVFRNGAPIRRDPDFDTDVKRLIDSLEKHLASESLPEEPQAYSKPENQEEVRKPQSELQQSIEKALKTLREPSNSGKKSAIEYLVSQSIKLANVDLSTKSNQGPCDLEGANLSGAKLRRGDLTQAILTDANLVGANLRDAILMDPNLSGANLTDANLSGTNLTGANLSEANLENVNLSGASLIATDLSEATLRRANLTKAKLFATNFSQANLVAAYLSELSFNKANLSGAKIWNANLSGATDLSQDQLDTAIGNADTKLPKGLNINTVDSDKKPVRKNLRGNETKQFALFIKEALQPSKWNLMRFHISNIRVITL